ncbi:MAG: penicillin-binding protein activator [Rhodothalassiaceae bacterium]
MRRPKQQRITITCGLLWLLLQLAGCTAGGTPSPAAAPSPAAEPPAVAAPGPGATGPGVPGHYEAIPELAPASIRVALLVPLSGGAADVGVALRDAATLALFDAYDPRLALVPYDTGGTPEGARAAARAARDDGAGVVIGPLFADSIAAAAPVLREAGIPLIGFSNDRRVADRGVYLMGFMPDQEVRRIIAFAAARGHRLFAGLFPLSAYGDRVLNSFGPAVLGSGGDVVALARYAPDPDRLADPIRRLAHYDERHAAYEAEVAALEALGDDLSQEILEGLKSRETLEGPGFDAILIAEGDPLLRTLAPLLPYYEIDPDSVQFLGTGLWDDPSLAREPPLRGAWFPAPDPDRPRAFLARLERAFGHPAPRIATLAYDAMALVATLARNPVKEDRFTAAAFTDPAGFLGLDGAFRFRPDGVAERRLAVLGFARGGFTIVDPAAQTFEPPRISARRTQAARAAAH